VPTTKRLSKKDKRSHLERRLDKLELDWHTMIYRDMMGWSDGWARRKAKETLAGTNMAPEVAQKWQTERLQRKVSVVFCLLEEMMGDQKTIGRMLAKVEGSATFDAALLDSLFHDDNDESGQHGQAPDEQE